MSHFDMLFSGNEKHRKCLGQLGNRCGMFVSARVFGTEHAIGRDIVAIGNTRIITPEGRAWDDWFDGQTVSDDFMVERDQPSEQQREGF